MSGRKTLGSLFVLAVLVPGLSLAQPEYGYGPAGSSPGPWPPYATSPAGSQGPGYALPPQAGNGRSIYEVLPDDPGFLHEDSPVEDFLTNLFRHSYYRGEYLLWRATRPGNVLLGGTPVGGYLSTDPTTTTPGAPQHSFTVTNPLTSSPGVAIEPSLAGFDIRSLNGFRGTMGLPIGPGAFEVNAFVLQTNSQTFDGTSLIHQEILPDPAAVPPTLGTPGIFIGQPISVAGAAASMLYTQSYTAVMKTGIWGSEANYICSAPNAGTGDLITFSPLVGLRYLNYRETLQQFGVYDFVTDSTTNPVTSVALPRSNYSSSNNNYYGPQIGVRAELNVPGTRATFGAEPKIMFGVNSYTVSVDTINIPSDTAGATPAERVNVAQSYYKKSTVFGPVADLKLYSRVAISEYAHVFVSYNLIWAGTISRPYNNVSYTIPAAGSFLSTQFADSVIQGLSVGGELRF